MELIAFRAREVVIGDNQVWSTKQGAEDITRELQTYGPCVLGLLPPPVR